MSYDPKSMMAAPFYMNPYVHPMQPHPYARQMPQPTNEQRQTGGSLPNMLPLEQSYIENILRLNRGKEVTVYMTFESGNGSEKKVFKGRIEAAGRDHIILSDQETGKRYLLLMVYLDYVTFDEPINYAYPLHPSDDLSTYEPR